jgi:hypothetical protein
MVGVGVEVAVGTRVGVAGVVGIAVGAIVCGVGRGRLQESCTRDRVKLTASRRKKGFRFIDVASGRR